jgi:hypothetical protein
MIQNSLDSSTVTSLVLFLVEFELRWMPSKILSWKMRPRGEKMRKLNDYGVMVAYMAG